MNTNTENNSLNPKIKKSSNNIMITDFIKKIEKEEQQFISRHIEVDYEKKKKGIKGYCRSDHKPWSLEDIQNDRCTPGDKPTALSIYLNFTDIWVIDVDTKEVEGCEIYDICKKIKCPYAKTNKGYHFYIKMKNCGYFSRQNKVYYIDDVDFVLDKNGKKTSKYEIDLLHWDNNVWEPYDRKIYNSKKDIPEMDWNEVSHLFNVENMNFGGDPPSPIPKGTIKEKKKPVKKIKIVKPETPEINEPNSPVFSTSSDEIEESCLISIEKLTKTVMKIKNRYQRDDWRDVGYAIHNETKGSKKGRSLFLKWSKIDKNFDMDGCLDLWEQMDIKNTNQITYGSLKLWAGEVKDQDENKYQKIYNMFINEDTERDKKGYVIDVNPNVNKLMDLMNEELKLCVSSAFYIKIDKEEKEIYEHKKNDMANIYEKFKFKNEFGNKPYDINPFELWCKNIKASQIKKIIWNPDPSYENKNYLNTFEPFNITREKVFNMYPEEDSIDYYNDPEIVPILDHIDNIICKNDVEKFTYFMNWLAHIVQKPHIQTGVVIALKSVQGSGKGVVWNDFLKPIIGAAADQMTKMSELTGMFNGSLHHKVLINLNECVWGGNKNDKGILKSIITEPYIKIRKLYKNPEEYKNYINFLIDSNEDYIIPADDKERRYNLYECDNKWGNRKDDDEEMIEYFRVLRDDCSKEKFARFLYGLDISDFNPRSFKKTEELQEQVEHGWAPLVQWWYNYINDEGFNTDGERHYYNERTVIKDSHSFGLQYNGPEPKIIYDRYDKEQGGNKKKDKESGKYIILSQQQWIYQDFFYDNYINSQVNKSYKLSKRQFWVDLQRKCTGELKLRKIKDEGGRRLAVKLDNLTIIREKFNELQSTNYTWKDEDNCKSDSEEEDEEDDKKIDKQGFIKDENEDELN